VISPIWDATTAKRMKIDLYRQRQLCNPLNVLFSALCSLRRFAVDFFARGLHTCTAVARFPWHQLRFLIIHRYGGLPNFPRSLGFWHVLYRY